MKPLDQINAQNGSDGNPALDTHPGRTTGLPRVLTPSPDFERVMIGESIVLTEAERRQWVHDTGQDREALAEIKVEMDGAHPSWMDDNDREWAARVIAGLNKRGLYIGRKEQ